MLLEIAFYAACAVGVAVAWMLFRSVRASATRLDRRIEEYHEEGPPADPFSEFAKIVAEDEKSKRRPRSKKDRENGGS